MTTLDVTRLSDEDLGRLCALEQLNWSVLNISVGQRLIGLRQELLRARQQNIELEANLTTQRQEIRDLRNEIAREQSEKDAVKTAADQQRRRLRELEDESQGKQGTIVKQASDIVDLKEAKKKCEDKLKRSTEANEAQRTALQQLKDENKATKAKEIRLMKEVERLKEEIRRMAARIPPPAPPKPAKHFPPLVKKGQLRLKDDKRTDKMFDIPDGIIAYLTRECGGNVHDHDVVKVTSSGTMDDKDPIYGAKNAADLEIGSRFQSDYCNRSDDLSYPKNNWICYDFKSRTIVPTHYTIRTWNGCPGSLHLKSWLVETSTDGKSWLMVAREDDNQLLNGRSFTATFTVAAGAECRFIRLVNIGRNHHGDGQLVITAWEIFGGLIE
jgi:hypothetical protein